MIRLQRGMTVATLAVLASAGAVLAAPTAQQKCDSARNTAWRNYHSCVQGVIAKNTKGTTFDEFAAFAKCRHKYFARWATFQSYTGSTCIGARFTDNGDQTVTDNLSGLAWEKKDNLGGTRDKDNGYNWSTGAPYKENGTVFTTFLMGVAGLNPNGFGGSVGWRLPTLAELQTIVLDFPCKGGGLGPTCSCPSSPCIDPALDAGNTQLGDYWSATTYTSDTTYVWTVFFDDGSEHFFHKAGTPYVRAVRGGL